MVGLVEKIHLIRMGISNYARLVLKFSDTSFFILKMNLWYENHFMLRGRCEVVYHYEILEAKTNVLS